MGDRTVRISVERDESVHKIPYFLVGRMKNVRAILVHMNALDLFAVNISSQMRAFVNDETPLPRALGKIGERGSKKAGSDNKIIEWFHY